MGWGWGGEGEQGRRGGGQGVQWRGGIAWRRQAGEGGGIRRMHIPPVTCIAWACGMLPSSHCGVIYLCPHCPCTAFSRLGTPYAPFAALFCVTDLYTGPSGPKRLMLLSIYHSRSLGCLNVPILLTIFEGRE